MTFGSTLLIICGLAMLTILVIGALDRSQAASKNQAAFRVRDRSTAGQGMVPAADVAGRVFEWSTSKNPVIGLQEYELRVGGDLVGQYWLRGFGELLEAETCEGVWIAKNEERGGWRRAYEHTLTLHSGQVGGCEVQVECGYPSGSIFDAFVGWIVFSDGCEFAWRLTRGAGQESSFPFGWLHSRRVLYDRHNDTVLESTGSHQVTVSKQGASNHHLTLLALLVSYLEVWQLYDSAD